jgi:hypothetical protein
MLETLVIYLGRGLAAKYLTLEEMAWNFAACRAHDKTILLCCSFKQSKINVVVSNRRYNR